VGEVEVRRARIEEIRPLAAEYKVEQEARFGAPTNPPLPQGGIFWLARDRDAGVPLGYAAGTLRPSGCTIGPVFTRAHARRRGVGDALLTTIQRWAEDTRVPVVEISVAVDNEAGLAFLESLGYQPRRLLMSLTPEHAKPMPRA
jgi:GNAT superfamily N-acetyltransferase